MSKRSATKWVRDNKPSIPELRELVDDLPDEGMSKVNRAFTLVQTKRIFYGGLASMESRYGDKPLPTYGGVFLIARNIAWDCGK